MPMAENHLGFYMPNAEILWSINTRVSSCLSTSPRNFGANAVIKLKHPGGIFHDCQESTCCTKFDKQDKLQKIVFKLNSVKIQNFL